MNTAKNVKAKCPTGLASWSGRPTMGYGDRAWFPCKAEQTPGRATRVQSPSSMYHLYHFGLCKPAQSMTDDQRLRMQLCQTEVRALPTSTRDGRLTRSGSRFAETPKEQPSGRDAAGRPPVIGPRGKGILGHTAYSHSGTQPCFTQVNHVEPAHTQPQHTHNRSVDVTVKGGSFSSVPCERTSRGPVPAPTSACPATGCRRPWAARAGCGHRSGLKPLAIQAKHEDGDVIEGLAVVAERIEARPDVGQDLVCRCSGRRHIPWGLGRPPCPEELVCGVDGLRQPVRVQGGLLVRRQPTRLVLHLGIFVGAKAIPWSISSTLTASPTIMGSVCPALAKRSSPVRRSSTPTNACDEHVLWVLGASVVSTKGDSPGSGAIRGHLGACGPCPSPGRVRSHVRDSCHGGDPHATTLDDPAAFRRLVAPFVR